MKGKQKKNAKLDVANTHVQVIGPVLSVNPIVTDESQVGMYEFRWRISILTHSLPLNVCCNSKICLHSTTRSHKGPKNADAIGLSKKHRSSWDSISPPLPWWGGGGDWGSWWSAIARNQEDLFLLQMDRVSLFSAVKRISWLTPVCMQPPVLFVVLVAACIRRLEKPTYL